MAFGHLVRRAQNKQFTDFLHTQRERIRQHFDDVVEPRIVKRRMAFEGPLIRFGGTTDGYSDGAVLQCAGDEIDYSIRK